MDFRLILLCSLLAFALVKGQKESKKNSDDVKKATENGGKKLKVFKPSESTIDGKIVGGSKTSIASVPYQLSLIIDGKHACGASIIHASYALTAAHCTQGISSRRMQVRAGSSLINSGGQVLRVRRVIQHEGYSAARSDIDIAILELSTPVDNNVSRALDYREQIALFNYDIAILQLRQPLKASRKTKVAVLSAYEPAPGATGLVSGWGSTREDGNTSRDLQYVTVPIVDRNVCQSKYVKFNVITPHMICAGYLNGQKDACQGDSGGPLLVNGKQAGIVSWGLGCARANTPGVYTNLAPLIPWIRRYVPSVVVQ